MDRVIAAQALLDRMKKPTTYLEIGVNTGVSFIPIRATRKWGVDPQYQLTRRRRAKYAVWTRLGLRVEQLFRMPSDDFFRDRRRMLTACGIDVCLVDGLHTYEQSLRDVQNALEHLKPNGVILMHDCNPGEPLSALPARSIAEVIARAHPGWNGAWSGDVWKTVAHLRSLRLDLDVFVLDCDTGLAVVTRGRPQNALSYSEAEIRWMDYAFLEAHRGELLNLQPPDYFDEFLQRHARPSSAP